MILLHLVATVRVTITRGSTRSVWWIRRQVNVHSWSFSDCVLALRLQNVARLSVPREAVETEHVKGTKDAKTKQDEVRRYTYASTRHVTSALDHLYAPFVHSLTNAIVFAITVLQIAAVWTALTKRQKSVPGLSSKDLTAVAHAFGGLGDWGMVLQILGDSSAERPKTLATLDLQR